MNLLSVNFGELYERHLCRHSQFGINLGHILGVFGTYLALLGILRNITDEPAVVLGIVIPYVAVLAYNVPVRVLAALLVFLGLFFALLYSLPIPPVWLCVVVILVLYKIQVWSHKLWTRERDMTEFNKKYPKGVTLFFLLSLYELTILLNYLCFDFKSWAEPAGEAKGPEGMEEGKRMEAGELQTLP